jgi:hypothetical protein
MSGAISGSKTVTDFELFNDAFQLQSLYSLEQLDDCEW